MGLQLPASQPSPAMGTNQAGLTFGSVPSFVPSLNPWGSPMPWQGLLPCPLAALIPAGAWAHWSWHCEVLSPALRAMTSLRGIEQGMCTALPEQLLEAINCRKTTASGKVVYLRIILLRKCMVTAGQAGGCPALVLM